MFIKGSLCAVSKDGAIVTRRGRFVKENAPAEIAFCERMGSDFLLVIAVDDRAVLGDDEGVGVVFGDDGAQAADFVFGGENVENMDGLAGCSYPPT